MPRKSFGVAPVTANLNPAQMHRFTLANGYQVDLTGWTHKRTSGLDFAMKTC